MRIRWFGPKPWTPPEGLCDPIYHIDTPVETKCLECIQPIREGQRGVVTYCSTGVWGHWKLKLRQVGVEDEDLFDSAIQQIAGGSDVEVTVCSYHLSCFLRVCVGGEIAGTVKERIEFQGEPVEEEEPVVLDEKDLQIGNWRRKRDG